MQVLTIVYFMWTFDLKVAYFSNLVRIKRAKSYYGGFSEGNINSRQLFKKYPSNLPFKVKCIYVFKLLFLKLHTELLGARIPRIIPPPHAVVAEQSWEIQTSGTITKRGEEEKQK